MKFVGIDPAGENNTWVAVLELRKGKLYLDSNPQKMGKSDLIKSIIDIQADCIVIDGPLNYDINNENGWRASDVEMRNISGINRNWIQSSNSMMAVPIVSKMIAEYLKPHCATIIETHPRVCLFKKYKGDEVLSEYVKDYKSDNITIKNRKYMTSCLSLPWIEELDIKMREDSTRLYHDGELDSLVCSIIGYYHYHQSEKIIKLNSGNIQTRGFGPLFILK